MQDFWQIHGWLFIIAMGFFPRLTLLLSSVVSGGIFWWLGWLFTPRLLVAILATISYGHTNTFLVVLTWIWTLVGESTEKKTVSKRINRKVRGKNTKNRFIGKADDAKYKEI
jgi:hypothetical protein